MQSINNETGARQFCDRCGRKVIDGACMCPSGEPTTAGAHVDVLEVMGHSIAVARDNARSQPRSAAPQEHVGDAEQARAAVVELIAADVEFDAAWSAYGIADTGKSRNETWAHVQAARARRQAAIAACKGDAS